MQNFQYILMVSPFWHWKFESAWFWKRRCFSNVKYDGSVKSVIYSFLEESFVGLKTPFSARVRNSLNIWKIGHLVIREIQSNRQWWNYSAKFISISFFFVLDVGFSEPTESSRTAPICGSESSGWSQGSVKPGLVNPVNPPKPISRNENNKIWSNLVKFVYTENICYTYSQNSPISSIILI